jgi:melibiose permease/lactose/raffinose/galactose permease
MLGEVTGSMKKAFFIFAIAIVVIMLAGQSITVFGVKEKKGVFKQEEKTTLKGMVKAIFKNDQLLFTAIAMILFMIGYGTTTGFGVYYFKYAFGNEDMFAIFAAILGVAQITALVIFPLLSKRFNRKKIYTGASILVLLGYVVFFFSPMNMIFIGFAGILLFVGQAFIQLLMLMFLADTVEYGQWKLGKRNESVTFALQPFIYKLSGAIAGGIVGITLIISGINEAETVNDVTAGGITILKMAMFILPLAFILIGYLVYRIKYKIDEAAYKKILRELEERGDIHLNQGAMDADN